MLVLLDSHKICKIRQTRYNKVIMADTKAASPKYKSIDDILEALKEHAEADKEEEEESPAENQAPETPARHIKTAKELTKELSNQDSTQKDDDEAEDTKDEAVSRKNDDDPESDKAPKDLDDKPGVTENDTPPQKSQVFGSDDEQDNDDDTANNHPKSPENPEPPKEPTFNLGNHPSASSPDQTETSQPLEHNFEDLASEHPEEDLSHNPDDDFDIHRIKPSSGQAGPSQTENLSGLQARHAGNFNTKPFEYTVGGQSQGGKKIHLLVLAIIGLLVIGGSVYFLKNTFKSGSPAPTPEPTSTPEPTPSPSPTPIPLDRSKFKIRVLNGTSQSGLAGTISDQLKGLGYSIDRTGNATNSAFTNSVVRTKSASTGLGDQLVQDLGSDFNASASGTLKDSDPADGEVILGQK